MFGVFPFSVSFSWVIVFFCFFNFWYNSFSSFCFSYPTIPGSFPVNLSVLCIFIFFS